MSASPILGRHGRASVRSSARGAGCSDCPVGRAPASRRRGPDQQLAANPRAAVWLALLRLLDDPGESHMPGMIGKIAVNGQSAVLSTARSRLKSDSHLASLADRQRRSADVLAIEFELTIVN